MDKPIFSVRLAELRSNRGLTQQQVADETDLTRARLNNYEQGIREPDLTTLAKLAQFFNVTVDSILGLPTPNHPEEPGRSQNYMTPEEIELIRRRRKVTDTTKDTIDRLIQADEILKKNSNASPFSS